MKKARKSPRSGESSLSVSGKKSKAMSDQIMAADKKRLKNKLDTLSKADMLKVEAAIQLHLGILGR